MGITIGPADWWIATPESINSLVVSCPEGTFLPDGSAIICKSGGTAWIVAPSCTEVSSTWNGTTDTQVGAKPLVCDWSTLCSKLISCGFNPCDWFVPSSSQLQNPGYVCRSKWDTFGTEYWSSSETNATSAPRLNFSNGNTHPNTLKSCVCSIRAFRCVTY